ncbi:MAG TPA: Re/Si-specific NAD(P)(+) transhydrogenase subunit alpha [Bacteroidia bacterium]|nr:Re/Si-specific NAD(P)(+) transhydrogenase subunit alpha [Sphingobacteriales bacterium]HPD65970.1 Re/Si-specific NAD(P)(+) transhydrogenase subunit alpha [Bacteroidia bacterium]HRS59609.1 Re/Si-specific NAD(P)(+) transhydrogenase subunit alpha [Bacteroidia bacterium]HRU68217.1 Re/Si-specific NAD(P)(+) transhydrogenase subunit alpha [Bacteroidia bacterium]
MILGILKEKEPEKRVALLPEDAATLVKMKVHVRIESGAGETAFASDNDYVAQGVEITDRNTILTQSDIVICINTPEKSEMDKIGEQKTIMSVFNPLSDVETVKYLKNKNLTAFSFDIIPRTTRAQAMDILSSMATVSGYRAVLDAARFLPTFFPMFMTAAGTIKPAKVLILGAGVAGLQALATARKLGAQVEVFDVRSAVREEVKSLGGKFVEVEGAVEDKAAGGYAVEQTEEYKRKQQEAIHNHAVKSDVIIATAQIPGKRAPILLKKETVEAMKPGSVIIDLAASTGGNCELTENASTVVKNGVTIIGKSDYPATMPVDASRMFGKNIINFLKLLIDKEGNYNINLEDDIVKGTCVTHSGNIISERIKSVVEP